MSAKVIRDAWSVRAGVTATPYAHSSRNVDRPPAPAGKVIDAAPGAVVSTAPSRSTTRCCTRSAQDVAAQAVDFLVAHCAVAVGVHALALLEGRNLGHVDHDVEVDPIGPDRQSRVVVDREVAERMGEGSRREEGPGRDGERNGEQAESRATSHVGEGTTHAARMDDEHAVPRGPGS